VHLDAVFKPGSLVEGIEGKRGDFGGI